MKKIFCLLIIVLSFSSCKKWLDINDNPNSANSAVPTAEQRLPSIIANFADGYESAGTRAAFISQQLAVTYSATSANWGLTRWYSTASSANWPWQSWYVNTAVNIEPLIVAAQKVDAYHYIGVAKIIKAWGFGTLADFYGMLPYDEFDITDNITPKFDDGEYVQSKILTLLDEGIADLQKTQGSLAPDLSKGDILNNGRVDNWIRLAYGLKARYLNHLTKKSSYDPQAVLNALANAPQTDAQSSIMQYVDESPATSTTQAALQYVNTGTSARITKLYYDYITNNYTGAPSGAANMEDPRTDLLIPSYYTKGEMKRSIGVDMQSALPATGPTTRDSAYVPLRKNPVSPAPGGRIFSTGTWYTQRGAKGLLLTNAEMRFIEAEVKFRQGRPMEALSAYKAGIHSHMSIMGISESTISAYLNSTSVVQNAANLTLSHIMIQKYIALSYSPELWVDLRRNNYCADAAGNYNEAAGVYKGFKRPSHVFTDAYPSSTDWPRRFAVASYEINFNNDQVLKANPNAGNLTYLNEPIWWDKP